MKKLLLYLIFCLSAFSFSQETLSELLKQSNNESIPYISVQELAMPKTDAIILDAREQIEYKVSHIKNAINVGYDFFNLDSITNQLPNKSSKIVVYCSLGIRSEDIAEKLKKAGYTNIYNLYGGIFEWKNKNFKVYNTDNQETKQIHAFNVEWSKWLKKGTKVYE